MKTTASLLLALLRSSSSVFDRLTPAACSLLAAALFFLSTRMRQLLPSEKERDRESVSFESP